jgi:hypothetical protein
VWALVGDLSAPSTDFIFLRPLNPLDQDSAWTLLEKSPTYDPRIGFYGLRVTASSSTTDIFSQRTLFLVYGKV